MLRTSAFLGGLASVALLFAAGNASAAEISGKYLEARTCQVYTGPCFANGEVGLTGRDAMMAWTIDEGQHAGVDLAGLSVVVVVKANDTLGFAGLSGPKQLKSVILVDEQATDQQRAALVEFARRHSGPAGEVVARVQTAPIAMSLDTQALDGKLEVGKIARLVTRKARPTDCICSNESAYYPPLAQLENFAPGVAVDGHFSGRGLGTQWSIPGSRSAYMATFAY
jgi:hypothetical protein